MKHLVPLFAGLLAVVAFCVQCGCHRDQDIIDRHQQVLEAEDE